MALVKINVPDIGDFKDVPVIEVLVKPGDRVTEEQSLITLESDKASMEIPSTAAGVVKDVLVKVGDTVSEGTPILTLEAADAAAAPQAPAAAAPPPATAAPPQAAARYFGDAEAEYDLLVLGGGPGGYSAAFRGADLGLKTVLIERYPTLGGVCLNVGCIPSKALLHVAATIETAAQLKEMGVSFGAPEVDIEQLRKHKEQVVARLTGGLATMARMRKVTVEQGTGRFLDDHHLEIELAAGGRRVIRFKAAIIAAGSEAVRLPFLPEDPRIVTSTGALELPGAPKRMLVIGGGIIGLEMGTVYSTLFGTRLDVVETLPDLMQGADRDLFRVWHRKNAARYDHVLVNTRAVAAEATTEGIRVTFEGEGAPEPQVYDLVLQAVGRRPNGKAIGAEWAGVGVSEHGFIPVDRQQRTNVAHIHAIGDIVGQPMLAHKAVHEGHVAAEVIAGTLLGDEGLSRTVFDARVIPSVAYTDPEVAWVGLTEDEAKAGGVEFTKGVFPWNALGRAIANGRDEGVTKLLFDAGTGRIVGGAIVGTQAGDMIGEIALAIEMGANAVDIGHTIHPHPTLGESLGMAAEVAEGTCTDLPPKKKI